ncbi:MAG: carboxypeptidase-like regulatory domain-containing protein, partial [Calditrichota bacterium]
MKRIDTVFKAVIPILLLSFLSLTAQEYGSLSGKITDGQTGQPLLGANIVVENTLLGTTAGNDGRYKLGKLPVGEHQLSISYIGYAHKEITVSIAADEETILDMALNPSSVLFDQVVVTGSQQAEDLAQAANSVNTMSHAEILPRGHHMLAGALQKLPAIDEIGENIS